MRCRIQRAPKECQNRTDTKKKGWESAKSGSKLSSRVGVSSSNQGTLHGLPDIGDSLKLYKLAGAQ